MINKEPLVSIIVPVYNAELYLNRCIDSILHQEYQNFELLLINDGSTDSSGKICDQYADNDTRIHVFHNDNSGVSSTRNFALDHCKGTYIQFLDSDDWIPTDSTKLLVSSAEEYQCDLIIADFYRVVGERLHQKGDIEENIVLTREEFAERMMENPADFYYGVLWNKLYRNSIISKYHLRMDPEIKWCEDFLFNLEYIRHSHSFYALQAPVYYYLKRKGSLVSQSASSISNTIKTKLNVFEYYNQFYKDLYKDEDYENIRFQVYRFLLSAAKDNNILPSPLSGAKKLGKERKSIFPKAIKAEGLLTEFYRCRKLLERLLETAAAKNNISLDEITIILYLNESNYIMTTKELAEYSGYSNRKVSYLLQKLTKKNLVKLTNVKRKITTVELLENANFLFPDLKKVLHEFNTIRFRNLSDKDFEQYNQISNQIQKNIQDSLL